MSQVEKFTQILMSFDDDKLHSSLYIFFKKRFNYDLYTNKLN